MEKKENYEELYGKLVAYEEEIHRKNQKRIKIGLKCLFIIPPVFLVLLFLDRKFEDGISDFMDRILIYIGRIFDFY